MSSRCAAPDEPLLLVAKVGNAMRVVAACPRARALGLAPGLALADARARLPTVAVHAADPDADARLLIRLADLADRWSPMVEPDPADGLLIDISGCTRLFGGEAALVGDILARFGALVRVRHALAGTPAAAQALARFPTDAANEADAVRQLPVAALRLDAQALAALRRAGLKRVGDLADRPTGPLVARFGEGAAGALDRLLGRVDSRIVPRRPLPALRFARRFAEPITHADAVLAVLDALAGKAAVALERRSAGGRHFAARLYRTDGAERDLAIETGAPTRDPALLGRLFRERIDALADPLDPGFGFDLIRFTIPLAEPLALRQPDLVASLERGDAHGGERGEALAALVDRLSIRHGRDRIRRFVAVDSHVPERAARSVPALDPVRPGGWPTATAAEPPLRPICLFDPPQPIDVLAEVPDAPPRRFRWRGADHIVARAEGPERIAAPWWRRSGEGRPTRDYYRVEDRNGRRFWLFRQGLHDRETGQPRWYLHGLFA